MVKNLLLGIAAALLASLSAIAIASADSEEVDPFKRKVSECDKISILHRVTEYTYMRFNLSTGVYLATLWTEDPNYDPATLEIWGIGQDGVGKRSGDFPWSNETGVGNGFEQYGKFQHVISALGGTVLY